MYWLPHSIRQFPLHFSSCASPCAITVQLDCNMVKSSSPKRAQYLTHLPLSPSTRFPANFVTILLLAFSLLELFAALSQCFVFRKQQRRMEKSANTHNKIRYFLTNKIFLLQVMYRYVRMIFIVKYVTITHFLLLVKRFDGKA